VPTQTLTKEERRAPPRSRPSASPTEQAELRAAVERHAKRARRLKIHVVAWTLGTVALTGLWVAVEWNANGAFERFADEVNPGDWNPTLWALAVGIWGLVVGIIALGVHFERPVTAPEIDHAAAELEPHFAKYATTADELRQFARRRLEGFRRLKFPVAAWVLGMVVITPLNALIEWQDNGPFGRLSRNSQPGSWDPWIVYIGGIWTLVIAALALRVYLDRARSPAGGGVRRGPASGREP
jgi:hypothetical protein